MDTVNGRAAVGNGWMAPPHPRRPAPPAAAHPRDLLARNDTRLLPHTPGCRCLDVGLLGLHPGWKGLCSLHTFFFFLPFPASRCHWISRLVVSSLIFKFGPHHIPPTIAPGVVSPRDGAGKGVLLFRTHVMTLSPPGPSRVLPPPRGHSLASVTFSLFPT